MTQLLQLQKGSDFDYDLAFSRSIGFLTPEELQTLRGKRIAIAGLGGVGGKHLLTLARLGIGKFHLADFDSFGIENFNRQAGADMTTIGKQKLSTMIEQALKINPELEIQAFPNGLQGENISEFLDGVDLYLDGLDFFAFQIRKLVFDQCYVRQIPAVTAGPIGMGSALINFLPGGMSFSKYFDWQSEDSELTLSLKFLVGLSPSLIQRSYLVHKEAVNLQSKAGPSTPMACDLCAGMAGTEILKILLKRGPVQSAPVSIHFDAYYNRMIRRKIWWGNRNPIQKLKIAFAKRILRAGSR